MLGKYSLVKELLLLFTGLSICAYFVYIRIIIERLPKNANQEWSPILFTVYLSLFFIFAILLQNHVNPPTKISRTKQFLLEKILIPLASIYKKALAMVYVILEEYTPIQQLSHAIIISIGEHLQNANLSLLDIAKAQIIIVQLPRILTLSAFYVDVFLLQQYYYLYKIMPLLIIPLLWNILLYLLDKQWESQVNWYACFVDTQVKDGKITCSPKMNSTLVNYYKPTNKDYLDITSSLRQYFSFKKLVLEKLESGSKLFQLNSVYCLSLLTYMGYAIIWLDLAILQLVQLT